MKWNDLSTRVQVISTVLPIFVVVSGLAISGYEHMHTDAEAAEHVKDFQTYQLQQRKERKAERIEIFELERDDIDFRLLDSTLSPEQRTHLLNQRKDIDEKIQCLRKGEC